MKLSGKANILYTLKEMKLKFVTELVFAKPRRFRFDFALVDQMVAIEYEGIVSGKSRHTSITGYTKDTEKYNLAVVNGWRVLRYTALNHSNLKNDLESLLRTSTVSDSYYTTLFNSKI